MPWPRPRFTLRRLLQALPLIAIAMVAGIEWGRSRRLLDELERVQTARMKAELEGMVQRTAWPPGTNALKRNRL